MLPNFFKTNKHNHVDETNLMKKKQNILFVARRNIEIQRPKYDGKSKQIVVSFVGKIKILTERMQIILARIKQHVSFGKT